jgi:LmbE family N-acetylglucosaminyl deacetylase
MSQKFKLMAILALPDDESLGFGGTLAKYAEEDVETHLVTATRGERGRFGSLGKGADPAEVGRVRETELRAAAAVLGIRDVFPTWWSHSAPRAHTVTRTTSLFPSSLLPPSRAQPMADTTPVTDHEVTHFLLTALPSSTIWRGEMTSGTPIRPLSAN